MRRLVVAITGTPGTGKSTFAKQLSKELASCKVIEINDVVDEHRLYSRKDRFGSKIVDMKRLDRTLKAEIGKADEGVVLVVGHLVPDLDFNRDVTVVLRAGLRKLVRRLESRGYPKEKIRENLVSEATNYCGIVSGEKCVRTYEAETAFDKKMIMVYISDISRCIKAEAPPRKVIEKLDELLGLIKEGNAYGL